MSNENFCAGDSTCARYSILNFPNTGIGQGLELYIKPEIIIDNHAVGGRSSFLEYVINIGTYCKRCGRNDLPKEILSF